MSGHVKYDRSLSGVAGCRLGLGRGRDGRDRRTTKMTAKRTMSPSRMVLSACAAVESRFIGHTAGRPGVTGRRVALMKSSPAAARPRGRGPSPGPRPVHGPAMANPAQPVQLTYS